MGATHMEKSAEKSGGNAKVDALGGSAAPQACSILDPDCEACQ